MTKALKRIEASRLDDLATKRDLREHDLEIKGELKLVKWMLVLVIAVTVLPALKTLFGL